LLSIACLLSTAASVINSIERPAPDARSHIDPVPAARSSPQATDQRQHHQPLGVRRSLFVRAPPQQTNDRAHTGENTGGAQCVITLLPTGMTVSDRMKLSSTASTRSWPSAPASSSRSAATPYTFDEFGYFRKTQPRTCACTPLRSRSGDREVWVRGFARMAGGFATT
jgi:hypothetical protein